MPSVNIVYVEWGSGGRAKSLTETFNCVAASGASINQLVIVDNRMQCAPLAGAPARHTTVIEGDNSARDFSGWDAGVKAISDDADVLLCVNDTFAMHRRVRLARRMRIAQWINIVAGSRRPEMFGQVDPLDHPVEWPFGTMSRFLCSYLFGINRSAAKLIMPLTVIDAEAEAMLNTRFSPSGLYADHVSKDFRARVERWLFTAGKWRNAAPLTPSNFDFFRLKAKSVVYEHALICRAEALGIVVSDLFTGRGPMDRIAAGCLSFWMKATMAIYQSLPEPIRSKLRHTAQTAPRREQVATR